MRNFLGRIRERGGMCVRGGDKISLDPIDSINLDPENFHSRFFSPLRDYRFLSKRVEEME